MASRHLARSIAMQSLFEWDFNGKQPGELDNIAQRNFEEFAQGLKDTDFVTELLNGVSKNLDKIDQIIVAAAPQWPIEQIGVVDRNVLRLGLYELLFGNKDAVPPKVAINEAIELGKAFGEESSGRFINGVLGTVYKQMKSEAGEEEEQLGETAEETSQDQDNEQDN